MYLLVVGEIFKHELSVYQVLRVYAEHVLIAYGFAIPRQRHYAFVHFSNTSYHFTVCFGRN